MVVGDSGGEDYAVANLGWRVLSYVGSHCVAGTRSLLDCRRAVCLTFWDTSGRDDHNAQRPLSYPGTDFFLVCFSVTDRQSFERVRTAWYPEIQRHNPDTLFLLVGTKADGNGDPILSETTLERGERAVTWSEGKEMARELGAVDYHECSSQSERDFEVIPRLIVNTFHPAPAEQKRHKNRIKDLFSFLQQ